MSEIDKKKEMGLKLKKIREDLGLTQAEFSKKVSLTQAAISQFEKAERFPSSDALQRIAKGLGVTVDFILSTSDEEKADNPDKERMIQNLVAKLQTATPDKVLKLNRFYNDFLDEDSK